MLDADGRPLHVYWGYNRAELIADGVVHVIGLALGVTGAAALVVLAAIYADATVTWAVVVYGVGLIGLLCASAAYNMWPISRTKWMLRRIDHAAIFVLIAATYTPFITRLPSGPGSIALLVAIWAVALFGATLKIALPGRFDRLSIVLCVLLGLSGGFAWDMIAAALQPETLTLILAGGLVYIAGIAFHLWESLRFQNAVWHGFVLVASALFYVAILDGVVLV